MTAADDAILHRLWRFVRRDTSVADFERWAYDEEGLEAHLGCALYLQAVSTNFSDRRETGVIREALADHARSRSPRGCLCIRLRDLDVVDMGYFDAPRPAFESDREWSHDDVFQSLAEVRRRGGHRWWLWAAHCRVCRHGWLVGADERQNDVFCLRRVDESELAAIEKHDRWPPDFDNYENLLDVGRGAGKRVDFVDPEGSSSLRITIVDLAKQRPSIAVSEIASLLNLDTQLASRLARRAVQQDGVQITFDADPPEPGATTSDERVSAGAADTDDAC